MPAAAAAAADNLRCFGSEYYQRRTLTYTLSENDDLWPLIQQWQQTQQR